VTLYFNLESLVLPDSQVHPFYTPSSRPIFGDVRRCSTMFGEVRRGSAMLSDVIRCSAMFGDVRRCSAILSDVQRYYPMFSDIIRASIHDRDSPTPSAHQKDLQKKRPKAAFSSLVKICYQQKRKSKSKHTCPTMSYQDVSRLRLSQFGLSQLIWQPRPRHRWMLP